MARLELRGVEKTYRGGIAAAQGVHLTVESGELFVIVGPSGSGKSTLLRLIAGLETLDAGSIHLGDRRIDGLAPRDRDLAMVFQDPVVYPHLNVFENIAFGLKARRVGRDEIRSRVAATAAWLGLADLLDRNSTTLSGGQKRRVTLARGLVLQPMLFLFDEPFTGLDAPLRLAIRGEIADLHRQTAATIILVTHDQGEALALADRLAVVDAGRVVQVGRPLDVYDAPCNSFVARFLGQPPMALLPCTIQDHGPDAIRVELVDDFAPSCSWVIPRDANPSLAVRARQHGATLLLGLRAEQVSFVPGDPVGPPSPEVGWVDRVEPSGHETGVLLRLGSASIWARVAGRSALRSGEVVRVSVDLAAASWFDSETGDRIA